MITRVQFTSSATGTATFANPTTAGNLIVVFISADGSNSSVPLSVALTGSSDTFTNDSSAASTNPTANITLSLWSDPDCSGGHTVITPTFSASPAAVLIMAWEVSGAALTSPLVTQSSAANPANTLQSAFDSGNGSSVQAGCWWAGAVTGVGSGGRAIPVPSGSWTTETPLQPGSLTEMLGAYEAGPGSGTPDYAGTFSAPVAGAYWASVVAAYAPAGAGVTGGVSTAALTAPTGTLGADGNITGATPVTMAVTALTGAAQSNAVKLSGPVSGMALSAYAGSVLTPRTTMLLYTAVPL